MALLGERPDIHVVNAMAWLNDLGGKTRKSNLIALKTHTSAVLGQFSKMPNISDSPLIKQFTRCLNLNNDSKARYNVIWNIQKLFDHISNSTFSSPEQIQMKAIALLVSFSAARMTELSRMTMKDLHSSQNNTLIIATIIKKGNKIRNETITINRIKNQQCPAKALQSWIQSRVKINIQEESLFWYFKKHTIPSSHYCSQTVTTIIHQFEIYSPYNGLSIRHATMTKLRASGASVLEVNAFSCYILTSTVVDAFYYRPIQRDLGSLLIKSVRPNKRPGQFKTQSLRLAYKNSKSNLNAMMQFKSCKPMRIKTQQHRQLTKSFKKSAEKQRRFQTFLGLASLFDPDMTYTASKQQFIDVMSLP
ncbi:MAG: hypothetical protein EZS28_014863 [Streblomastix strix]|uniref:Tyr recombinase domain-containing protein n=1 Tax=Streblomastix strix TaxID=222440 RepID=A0A5J4W3W3_9EUKA|nr:MAG: hypothetical protein EZS28_014863 [Streblomastix strix]